MSHPSTGRSEKLPLFPLGTVLVPGMRLSLHVFEPRYRQLVADLLSGEGVHGGRTPEFGVVALRQGWEVGELRDVHDVGTTAMVTDVLPHTDGQCDLTAVGNRRFVIQSLDTASHPYLTATVQRLPEADGSVKAGAGAAVWRALQAHLRALEALDIDTGEDHSDIAVPGDALQLSYAIANLASLPLTDRQQLLEAPDTAARLRCARSVLLRETELLRTLKAVPANASTFRADFGTS